MAEVADGPSVVAFVPARGGSTGIARKNLRGLAGAPLVAHAIGQGLDAARVDRVVMTSEDAEIREVAARYGAEVISRPDEFAHDNTTQEVDRLLMWCIEHLESRGARIGVGVLLYATSPLRLPETIDETVRLVTEGGFDSALTLTEDTTYLWRREGDTATPINYDPKTRGPRQKERWNQWAENKAVYAFRRDLLMETGCRLGGRVGVAEMEGWRSVDIDRPDDLERVRALWALRSGELHPPREPRDGAGPGGIS